MSIKLQREYNEMFNYNPKTGVVTYKHSSKRVKAGDEVGTVNKRGYRTTTYKNKTLAIHTIAYVIHYGIVPVMIDHDNRIKDDNRISNLNNSTSRDNCRNAKKSVANTTGCTGVYKSGNKWRVYISNNEGKLIYLGSYAQIFDAIRVRKQAEKQLGYHKNHGIG